jgi:uncharacterized protein with PQ loop repeat
LELGVDSVQCDCKTFLFNFMPQIIKVAKLSNISKSINEISFIFFALMENFCNLLFEMYLFLYDKNKEWLSAPRYGKYIKNNS